MIRVSAIDHLNITVSDLDRSIAFFGRLFGFEVAEDCSDDQRPYLIMGKPGVGWLALHGQINGGPPEGGRINHWGFVVEDFDGLRDRLDSLGADVRYTDRWPDGIVEYPRSRSLYVADPDGNEIELTSAFGGALV